MKANANFSRFGCLFQCNTCNQELDKEGNELVHPSRKGIIFKSDSTCEFSGRRFKNPFREMALVETEQP